MRGGKANHYEWWHRPTKLVGPERRERVSHLAWSAALIRRVKGKTSQGAQKFKKMMGI